MVAHNDNINVDVKSPQWLGNSHNFKPFNEPMHDEHVKIGIKQRFDPQPVQEHVVDSVGKNGVECVGKAPMVEAFTAARHVLNLDSLCPHNLG